ncbi:response regulator [Paenibacillus nasutitermitis]|uniref:AraC family transcriptional regulator n=1 Tax=Paenibacillus nasutitermitis TaxID=1652958 RepID=A0A916ZGT4_9BACL|nr:response regulator [Paenibacillus nasutitermitis]GGD95981.1 AraC family transcriptional regulator [Paenibacillus nasutitermitis]
MYKVIIVDDEIEIREGLRTIFPWQELGEFEVYTAENANHAMQMIEEVQPDILITDVKMNGMTGLQMLEMIQNQGLFQGRAIVISGFDDFEYIRTALQNGAVDYILKPINIEQMKQMIMKATSQINDEKRFKLNYELLESQVNQALPQMREEILRELIKAPFDSILEAKITYQMETMKMGWMMSSRHCLFAIEVDDLKASKQSELVLFAVGNVLEQTLNEAYMQRFAMFKDRQERWVVLLAENESGTDPQSLDNLIQTIITRLNIYVKVTVTIGLYPQLVDVKHTYHAYREAIGYLAAKAVYGGNRILAGETGNPAESDAITLDDVNVLLELIQFGSIEEIQTELAGYTGLVQSWSLSAVRDIQERTFEWLLELLNVCAERGLRDRWWEKEIISIWEEFEQYDTMGSLQGVLEKYLFRLSDTMKQQMPARNQIVQEAEHYMLKHFQDNLSLQAVADHVHVTPVWLSKLFKKEKQMTFIDYLTWIRMERAKELLGDTSYRIYQIALEVGYRDRAHFAKTFKKITGKTPKDYRNFMGIYDE